MDSSIEWSPVRSIAAAAADDQQQLASQAANELRMRSLQVRPHSSLTAVVAHCNGQSFPPVYPFVHLYPALNRGSERPRHDSGSNAGWACRIITCTLSLCCTPRLMSSALSQNGS